MFYNLRGNYNNGKMLRKVYNCKLYQQFMSPLSQLKASLTFNTNKHWLGCGDFFGRAASVQ